MTRMSTDISPTYLGVDIAKDSFQFFLSKKIQGRLPNTLAGCRRLIALIRQFPGQVHVLCEASGGYERRLLRALHQAKLTVSLLNPARVRHFAKGMGLLAKTDLIDARLLAACGELLQPQPTLPRHEAVVKLQGLVRHRDQLIRLRTQLHNQLDTLPEAHLRRGHRGLLRQLERQLKQLDTAIASTLAEDPDLAAKSQALQEEPGIGPQSAAALLAEVPELGSLNRGAAAALVGLAPYNRDSGARRGHRYIRGGRARGRRALYMPALVASRHHPQLRPIYQRLIQRGKPPKVALVALMRHFIIRLNNRLKNL